MTQPFIIYGMEASWFTRKVLALFDIKEIPCEFRRKSVHVREEVERRSGSRLMPVVVTPEDVWLWDSTPIAFALERRFPRSPLLPAAPLALAVTRLLEDFFDEWPTRQALFYRWSFPEDRAKGGGSIARDLLGLPQDAGLDAEQAAMLERSIAMIEGWMTKTAAKIGADRGAADEMEGEFVRLVTLLDRHLAVSPFLLGGRPCLADIALYGGLAAHFLHDPTPRRRIAEHGPALIGYAERMASARASVLPAEIPFDAIPETLAPLLQHVALGFHDFLRANHAALAAGAESFELDLGYGPRRLAVRSYAEKTRAETARALANLPAGALAPLEPLGVLDVCRMTA